MKKIFTLAALALFATAASAQTTATPAFRTLDKTLVFYLTNDTTSTQMAWIEDPETGEEVESLVAKPWDVSSMIGAFNACGIGLGANTEDLGYTVETRNAYTDAETGFTMPAGLYRGATCTRSRFTLQGNLNDGSSFKGFKNIKKAILYLVPIPTAWLADGSVSHQDYPTGRIEAAYLNETGGAVSNTAYREMHITQTDDPNASDTQNLKGTNLLNFSRDANNVHHIIVDQPFKLTVNLQNQLDGSAYEPLFAKEGDGSLKTGEFENLVPEAGATEASMDYYFGDVSEIHPYKDNAETTGSTGTGYDVYNGKWSTKLAWTAETAVSIAVKYRMYLVGVALVSATDGAASQFMNASELANAKWSDSAQAYGVYTGGGTDGINEVKTAEQQVKPRKVLMKNGQIMIGNYNILGQRVK